MKEDAISANHAGGANADEKVYHHKEGEMSCLAGNRSHHCRLCLSGNGYLQSGVGRWSHKHHGGGEMREGACAPSHSVPHLIIPYTQEMISGICSMDDFYKAVELTVLVKDKTVTHQFRFG